jgi:OPA family glycerol-3-phosphate transporter-like MFS transporter
MINRITKETNSSRQRWQWRIIGTVWLTYVLYYVGRMNLAVALPVIESEFGWTTMTAGLVSSSFYIVYAFGQLINGSLGDRFSARWYVFGGLLGSAVCNLFFGFSSTLLAMAAIWGVNGIFQSTGWGPIVKVSSHWVLPQQRNTVSTILGTSFVLGSLFSWWLSGQILAVSGSWRAVFWLPAAILALQALFWLRQVRDKPADAGLEIASEVPVTEHRPTLPEYFRDTAVFLKQPYLLLLAVTTVFQGMIKDGINLWMPALLMQTRGLDITSAVGYSLLVPVMGFAGVLAASWVNSCFKSDERKSVSLLFAAGAVIAFVLSRTFFTGSVLYLSLMIGVCSLIVNGINLLLLSSIPMRFVATGKSSTLAGYLDFASYVGSSVMTVITGLVVSLWGWGAIVFVWGFLFVLGAASMLANRKAMQMAQAGRRGEGVM